MKPRNYLCFFSLFFSAFFVNADEYTNLNNVVNLSKNHLLEKLKKELTTEDYLALNIKSKKVDYRLRLKKCAKPLTFAHKSSSNMRGTVSIKVTCPTENAWSIYTKHHISLEKSIIVLKNDLPKNHVITDNDLRYTPKDIYTLRPGYLKSKDLILGHQLKRSFREGQPIYNEHLKKPTLIKKGDAVNVIAKVGALSVMASGIALKDGRKGDQIRVENRRSSRIIHAKVIGPNTVMIIL